MSSKKPKIKIRELPSKIKIISEEKSLEQEMEEEPSTNFSESFSSTNSSKSFAPVLRDSGERQEEIRVAQVRQTNNSETEIKGQTYEARVGQIEREDRQYRATSQQSAEIVSPRLRSAPLQNQSLSNEGFSGVREPSQFANDERLDKKYEERQDISRPRRKMPWER